MPINPNSKKIVVIGAGIGGLTTGYRLHQAGMNVDVYEARGRVGGRIFTAKINGRIAELGGQNFTDGGKTFINVRRLIDEFELQCVSCPLYLNYYYFNGMNLTPIAQILKNEKFDPEVLKKELDKLASTHSNMKEVLEKIVDPQRPLYKIMSRWLAAFEGGPIEKLSSLYSETLFYLLLGGIGSVHQADKGADSSIDIVTIEGGNSLLPQKMGEALGSNLHLNMPLTKVSKNTNGRFQLAFQNGTEVETDILVLAIPCTVYDQIIFEKGIISAEKLEAIQNVQYGENAKIIVPFTCPSKAITVVGDESGSYFDPIKQTLTIYFSGSTSCFSPETIANSYTQARSMIEKGFENCPPFENPTYAKDEVNLSYEGPVGYSWPNDPYVKGSYSYIASGQDTLLKETIQENGETFKALFAPIDQSLYFVGEHTTILYDVLGTMEAACESGERIARTIMQH